MGGRERSSGNTELCPVWRLSMGSGLEFQPAISSCGAGLSVADPPRGFRQGSVLSQSTNKNLLTHLELAQNLGGKDSVVTEVQLGGIKLKPRSNLHLHSASGKLTKVVSIRFFIPCCFCLSLSPTPSIAPS